MACTCEVIILGSVFPGEHLVNQTLSFALCVIVVSPETTRFLWRRASRTFRTEKNPDYRCKNEREILETIRVKGYVLATIIYTF